jgi:hypothetical protein
LEVEHVLRDLGFILGAGLLAQFVATFLRVPEMIVLVAVGAVIGSSVLGIVDNPLDGMGARLIFTVGVAMILFHGGVGISLRVISQTPHYCPRLPAPGPAGTLDAQRDNLSELVPLHWGHPCRRSDHTTRPRRPGRRDRGLDGRASGVRHLALASHHRTGYVARRLGLIEEPGAP